MNKYTINPSWFTPPAEEKYKLYDKYAGALSNWIMENEEFEIIKRLAVYNKSAFVRLHKVIHKILSANSQNKETAQRA